MWVGHFLCKVGNVTLPIEQVLILDSFMEWLHHVYSFTSAWLCIRFRLTGPSQQNCGSFLSGGGGEGEGLPSLPVIPAWTWQRPTNSCKHTKQAFSCDQPGEAETLAHDTGWHWGLTCDLDSGKWDTHVGNSSQMLLSTTLCNARHACCGKAVCLLPGFHPDKYIYQGPPWVREQFTVSPTWIILESFCAEGI